MSISFRRLFIERGDMKPKTILVVEDADDIRLLMKMILEMEGYRVVEAINGQQALERALQDNLQLILMDLSMPVMDGWEATRRLRQLEKLRDVPIVGLSAHCHDHLRDAAIRAGCNDCIPKPVDEHVLNGILNEFLNDH
jgi:two-component system cell cycle response regulator DivK